MTKSFRESLDKILGLAASGFQDYATTVEKYREVRDEAKAALIEVVRELIPQKATPLSKTKPLSKRNVGWNEAITAILKKMEE